jgi:hypothetical protein
VYDTSCQPASHRHITAILASLTEAVIARKAFEAGRALLSKRLDYWGGAAIMAAYIAGVAVIALG